MEDDNCCRRVVSLVVANEPHSAQRANSIARTNPTLAWIGSNESESETLTQAHKTASTFGPHKVCVSVCVCVSSGRHQITQRPTFSGERIFWLASQLAGRPAVRPTLLASWLHNDFKRKMFRHFWPQQLVACYLANTLLLASHTHEIAVRVLTIARGALGFVAQLRRDVDSDAPFAILVKLSLVSYLQAVARRDLAAAGWPDGRPSLEFWRPELKELDSLALSPMLA